MQILSNTYNDACPVKITMYSENTKRKEKPWLSRGLKMLPLKILVLSISKKEGHR